MDSYKFPKFNRLKSRSLIARVFREGLSGFNFPIRFQYLELESPTRPGDIQVAFSVPKKKLPSAVDRNTIKRRMREAFRLHRDRELGATKEKLKETSLVIVLIYLCCLIIKLTKP